MEKDGFFYGALPKGMNPLESFNDILKKGRNKTTPATFKRGVINTIHPNGTADVQIVGNHSTILKGLYFSSAVNPSLARPGDKCRVDMFSEINPNDSVIAYIYGRQFTPLINKGYVTGSYTAGTQYSVKHGLGVVPNIYTIDNLPYLEGGTNVAALALDFSTPPNDTYLYFKPGGSGLLTLTFFWFAAYLG